MTAKMSLNVKLHVVAFSLLALVNTRCDFSEQIITNSAEAIQNT